MSIVLILRWSARVLSGLIVLFFGFFLVAHLVGDQGGPSRPLVWNDYVMLAAIVVSLSGLLLAWRWEFAGATITLIAILICAALNLKVLASPGALIPIAALLYLISSWLSGPQNRDLQNEGLKT